MISTRWPFAAIIFALFATLLVSGCGKYDSLQRNMQYVSSDLLRKESVVAYERLRTAHAAYKASPGQETLDAYKEYYAQYSVIHNELMDRSGTRLGGRLMIFSEDLPPPPPGVKPQEPAAGKPAEPQTAPTSRELDDPAAAPAAPSRSAKPVSSAEVAPGPVAMAQENTAAGTGTYVVRPGDTPHTIAKALHVSESRLMEVNGITDPSKLSIGKKLTIPEN